MSKIELPAAPYLTDAICKAPWTVDGLAFLACLTPRRRRLLMAYGVFTAARHPSIRGRSYQFFEQPPPLRDIAPRIVQVGRWRGRQYARRHRGISWRNLWRR